MELLGLTFERDGRLPLYKQLYQQIITAIETRKLHYGEKLPSKRKLAQYLDLSLNTIETAYAQLQAEGYIESKSRSGFYVSFEPIIVFKEEMPAKINHTPLKEKKYRFDFNPNIVDTALFPFDSWRKLSKEVLQQRYRELVNLGEKQGEYILRLQIAKYLFSSRGVNCKPEQIIIEAGVESCLTKLILLFDSLIAKPFCYGMEEYGYTNVESLLRALNKSIEKIPLDKIYRSLNVDELTKRAVNGLYITPSHQFPYGEVIDITRRHKLIEWARADKTRFIIEDDYDSEFRYKGNPVPALQQLDAEKVIYLGSFSKLLSPSMRITFMVLPEQLLIPYQQTCGFFNPTVPRFEQHVLAKFIEQGELQRHINRMRKNYRHKMEAVCHALQPYHNKVNYYGEQCGFYLLLEFINEERSLAKIAALTENQGIKIYPLQRDDKKLITLGFANLSMEEIKEGIDKLINLLIT